MCGRVIASALKPEVGASASSACAFCLIVQEMELCREAFHLLLFCGFGLVFVMRLGLEHFPEGIPCLVVL